jgi:hypothetical protein
MHRKMCCGGGEVGAGKKMHGEGRAAGTGEAREEEEGGGEGAKEEDEREGQARELGEEPGVGRRALCAECTGRWAMIDSAGVCVMLS